MNARSVDQLNIGLILLSLFLAYQLPFALFLYAYAILGPLHYLTEINWLSSRRYFVKDKWWFGLVLGLCALLVLPKFFIEPHFPSLLSTGGLKEALLTLSFWSNGIIFLLLALSLIILATPHRRYRLPLAGAAVVLAYFFNTAPQYGIVIGLLVPTLIHVYLFTFFFMVFGALKSQSKWGFAAAGCLLLVPLVIVLLPVDPLAYRFPSFIQRTYAENGFYHTPILLSKFLGLSTQADYQFADFFRSALIVKLQIFIAFAYIYHYLNWFSKTTVIGWHKQLSTPRALWIIGLWLTMTGLFLWNYRIGFYVALFFSFLHVFLEFPLNWVSIRAVLGRLVPRFSR